MAERKQGKKKEREREGKNDREEERNNNDRAQERNRDGFACRRFLQHSLLYSCVQASCGLCTRLQHCLPLFGALMHILAASLVERLRTDAETQPAPRGGAKEQKKFVKKKIPTLWA